jgi:hypothetical protein
LLVQAADNIGSNEIMRYACASLKYNLAIKKLVLCRLLALEGQIFRYRNQCCRLC